MAGTPTAHTPAGVIGRPVKTAVQVDSTTNEVLILVQTDPPSVRPRRTRDLAYTAFRDGHALTSAVTLPTCRCHPAQTPSWTSRI
jgi:hypothetical protein